MIRICLASLLVFATTAVIAAADNTLAISASELERLGIEFDGLNSATLIEVGSGPAEVVIPPTQQVVVGATVSGVLSRLLVAEGETVAVGQALAVVESPELLTLQRAYVNAVATNELTLVQLQRDRGLREEGIIAERRLQETAAAAQSATVALDQSRQHLRLAGMSAEQMEQLAVRQQLSSSLTLRSPIDGVIVRQLSSLGSQVNTSGAVFRVADLTQLWLEIRVSQQQAARIAAGMLVKVPEHDESLSAEVFHIGPVVDSMSQTVMIRAVMDNRQLALRPGQFLSARIVTGPPGDAATYAVPSEAVVRDGAGAFLFVRTADGVAARQVTLLSENGQESYVAMDVRSASQVVVTGVAALKSIWFERRMGER